MNNSRFIVGQLMACAALAKITGTGPWTGHDWEDTNAGIRVVNGVPEGITGEAQIRINAPKPIDGALGDYESQANVQLLGSFFTEETFEHFFPMRNPVYTYEGFVQAVGKFPYFCGENYHADASAEETCIKEVSALFAHMVQETSYNSDWLVTSQGIDRFRQGLHWLEELGCEDGDNAGCDYIYGGWAGEAWPPQDDAQYYGRGPLQLSYNFNYGMFSNVFQESTYDAKMYFLEHPEEVTEDSYTAFSAALWFYMTPQSPKPSMHDVMSGLFEPNDVDTAQGIQGGFGSTINILNGGIECGFGYEITKAANRGSHYTEFLNYFGLNASEETDLGCAYEDSFLAGGAGDLKAYFQKGSEDGKCELVTW